MAGEKFTDKTLYRKIVKQAKAKFETYPSAYANGWVTKTYKTEYLKKHGSLSGAFSDKVKTKDGLNRWYREKWVNVKTGSPCGRKSSSNGEPYPYCRPSKKISKKTPVTVKQLSPSKKRQLIAKKQSSPKTRSKMLKK